MYETNVFGVMRVSRAVLPIMRKNKAGTIVNVTSMAGVFGVSLVSTYASSKFAVEGLSEAMAIEYKPLGINIKTVALGVFGTNFTANTDNNLTNGDEQLQSYAQKLARTLLPWLNKCVSRAAGKPTHRMLPTKFTNAPPQTHPFITLSAQMLRCFEV